MKQTKTELNQQSAGYKDIDDNFISAIVSDDKIQVIQISKALPKDAFLKIDSILERKPELDFRIYSITSLNPCDISFLETMPHLNNLRIDCHLRDWQNGLDFNVLTKLKKIVLDNTAIAINDIDEPYNSMAERYWR